MRTNKQREEIYKKYTTPDASGNLPRLGNAGLLALGDPHPLGMAMAQRVAMERRRITGERASRSAATRQAQQAAMSLERAAAYRRQAGFGSSQFSAGNNTGMRLS